MDFEKILWGIAAFIMAGVLWFSGDGFYRYPCQDPANWDTTECKPPVCEVAGYCPVDLVGEDIFNSTSKDDTAEDTNVEGNK